MPTINKINRVVDITLEERPNNVLRLQMVHSNRKTPDHVVEINRNWFLQWMRDGIREIDPSPEEKIALALERILTKMDAADIASFLKSGTDG